MTLSAEEFQLLLDSFHNHSTAVILVIEIGFKLAFELRIFEFCNITFHDPVEFSCGGNRTQKQRTVLLKDALVAEFFFLELLEFAGNFSLSFELLVDSMRMFCDFNKKANHIDAGHRANPSVTV